MKRYYWLGGYVMLAMLIALLVSLVLPVQAATPAPTEENCVHIATANSVKIFRCIDEETNTEFYVNQLGFMLFEPY